MRTKTDYRILCLIALLCVSMLGLTCGCSHQTQMPAAAAEPAATPTLYERLGGAPAIAMVVDDVIERAYVDPVFVANKKIHAAHMRFPKPIYKFNATCLACQAFGGPKMYMGRSLKDAHWHLDIHEAEWQELIKIFRDSMTSFKVPAKDQDEVLAIIESTKGDIVHPAGE
jgi:hemoglobin